MHDPTLSIAQALAPHRRRLWIGRALDTLLVGLWTAGTAAGVTALLALWIVPLVGWAPWVAFDVVALAMGVAILRRPTLADAAIRLDRRHRLHDLLATAFFTPGNDVFDRTVRRQAAAVLAKLPRTSDVRFGWRAHAATVLAGLAVGGAVMLSADPERESSPVVAIRLPPSATPSDADPSADAFFTPPAVSASAEPVSDTPMSAASAAARTRTGAGDQRGDTAGTGTGRADAPLSSTDTFSSANDRPMPTDQAGGEGIVTEPAGTADPAGTVVRGSNTAGGTVQTPDMPSTAAPWTLDDWPAHAATAEAAAADLPPAYRPLIKAYFER